MLLADLKNKNIAIWGLGNEGKACVYFLQKHKLGRSVKIFETDSDVDLSGVDVIIKSPGVSIYKDELLDAKSKGIKISTSSDLFLSEMRQNHKNSLIIGISGSKGKSTSSSLLYHILLQMGQDVCFGGNIGKPLIELLEEEHKFVVCEFSSYQAADLSSSPNIVMFTNLFPEHIDWHQTHENYYRDKLHLAANQQQGDVCFINDKCEKLKARFPSGKAYRFEVIDNVLCKNGGELLRIEDTKLKGYHNLENIAGILSVVEYLGLDIDTALEYVKTFESLSHRLQKVAEFEGVEFINDSISTAPETAMAAIKSFDKKMGLILGGFNREQDYAELAEFINDNPKVKVVATLFQTGPRIAEELRKKVKREDFVLLEEQNLEETVEKIYQKLKDLGGNLVLFSPAAPSYGCYKSFVERGNHFAKIVEGLLC